VFGLRRKRRRLNLALQGGGAHGAFTWGVLDRLLEDPHLDFGWLSGTSAGAINAVAMASGLAENGREGARTTLRAIWEGVISAGLPDLLRYHPFFDSLSRSQSIGHVVSLFSPYQFNPLGFDPLRKLVEAHVDFARLRAFPDVDLLIAATDVATGRSRLFRRDELTIECVLASACLPTVHHAVEIDGRAYWDGGFSANPDLITLAAQSPVGDTLLVQLNPVEKHGVPRTARSIAADVNRITFGQPLLRDVAEIVALQKSSRRGWLLRGPSREERVARHRFHLIEAGRHTATLPADSKMRPDRTLVLALYDAGRAEADRWLDGSADLIAKRSSVDLEAHFLAPFVPITDAVTGLDEALEADPDPGPAMVDAKPA
jgi:NTE family protein